VSHIVANQDLYSLFIREQSEIAQPAYAHPSFIEDEIKSDALVGNDLLDDLRVVLLRVVKELISEEVEQFVLALDSQDMRLVESQHF